MSDKEKDLSLNQNVKRKALESRKLELLVKIRELESEMAKVNLDLHQQGVNIQEVLCW